MLLRVAKERGNMRIYDKEQQRLNMISYRSRKGFTQDDVAKILNVSRDTVNRWENDCDRVNIATLAKLGELYDCSVADFFTLINAT